MNPVIRQTPLYSFLQLCNENCPEGNILDCGAGGENPPLQLFSSYGYSTTGIEIDPNQVEAALVFSKMAGLDLGIIPGDMRRLTFSENCFDSVYSYNSIFHLRKNEIEKSLMEMKRVLRPMGLLFINFLSTDDFMYGNGETLGNDEFRASDSTIHSYHTDQEADIYFSDMKLVRKEKRVLESEYDGSYIKQGFIDYILQKF